MRLQVDVRRSTFNRAAYTFFSNVIPPFHTVGRVLYAPVQNRHNTGKPEAVVAYNTDQSLGSLGCF